MAADTAEHPIPYSADGSIKQLEHDLRYLKSLQPELVLPCHGGTINPSLIDRNLHYFKTLREKIVGVKSIKDVLPKDAPRHIQWGFEEAMQDLGLDAREFSGFYRDLHIQNIQAIVNET